MGQQASKITFDVLIADIGDGMYVAQASCNGAKANGTVTGNKVIAVRSALEKLVSQDNAEGVIAVSFALNGTSIEEQFAAIEAASEKGSE